MINVFDVAAYILEKTGGISLLKLQKLCYYSQAWSLVWDDKPLFGEEIHAWVNGPVVYELFRLYKGHYMVSSCPQGNPCNLTKEERDTVDAVLDHYGKYTGAQLSELTHGEEPWKRARKGLGDMEYGNNVVELGDMAEYYTGLYLQAM